MGLKETLEAIEEAATLSEDKVQTSKSPETAVKETNNFMTSEKYEEIIAMEETNNNSNNIEYAVLGDGNYRASPRTEKFLPPAVYKISVDGIGMYFESIALDTTELIRFKNTIVDTIALEIDKFWEMKEQYLVRGEQHKRGYLLWGAPGSGKSCLITFLEQEFVKKGHVVFRIDPTRGAIDEIIRLKKRTPEKKIMIVLEDIDSLIQDSYIEQSILQLLDGGGNLSDVVIIATTNYPEKLPDRIINRPSRFDRVEEIKLPDAKTRKIFIEKKSKLLSDKEIKKWVKDTKNFTLAHIKELIVAYEVFELDYDETLTRIKVMRKNISNSSDYKKLINDDNSTNAGFGS